jgi:hypothetical protein
MEKVKAVVGIDPGVKGAMALLPENRGERVFDWKTPQEMGRILADWASLYEIVLVGLEKVNAMPSKGKGGKTVRMGAQSAFNFGRNTGVWNGLIIGLALPYLEVTPQTWQKGLVGKKAVDGVKPSVAVAQRLFPHISLLGPKGGLKDGRADALLIAHWTWSQAHTTPVQREEVPDW